MRPGPLALPGTALMLLVLCTPLQMPVAHAEGDRSFHAVLGAGSYVSVGGPARWGPLIALDVLPGSVFQRWGVRGELRGYRGFKSGSALLGAVYEAAASRPRLALNLVAELGLTSDSRPIVGAGVETNLWLLGPLGVSSFSDAQVIIDGLGSRISLSLGLSLHLGL